MKSYLKHIPPRTLLIASICALCLISLITMYFYSRSKVLIIEKNVAEKRFLLKTQQEIQPIYAMLQKYDTTPIPSTPFLPSADMTPPLKGNLSRIQIIFSKIASESEVSLDKMIPDPSSISEEEQSIMITTGFSGRFEHFQKTLTMIALLPFVLEEHSLLLFSDGELRKAELKLKISLK